MEIPQALQAICASVEPPLPYKRGFFPCISFCARGTYLPAAGMCCPCVGKWHGTGSICLRAPGRCLPAAPASLPVGKKELGEGRQWCLPSPLCLWGSRGFQYPKGRVGQPGNATWRFCYGNSSWLSSKMGNSQLQVHFWGGEYAFPSLVYIGYGSECMSFVGNIQNDSYGS